MRARILIFIFTVAWIWTALAYAADAPPKDHPIYEGPLGFPTERIEGWVEKLFVMEFALAKKQFYQGEPIWGTLTVKNLTEDRFLIFSPPYHGQGVATVGVWRSYWQPQDNGGQWTKLEEAYRVNKSFTMVDERFPWAQYQGRPVNLAPGKQYSVALLINVLQSPIYFEKPEKTSWCSGLRFSRTGKYRFYLQYMNLENHREFEKRRIFRREEEARQAVFDNKGLVLPLGPVVLGPFEVEVLPLPANVPKEVPKLLELWEEQFPFPRDGELGNRCFADRITVRLTLERLAMDCSFQDEQLMDVGASLLLTSIRKQFSDIDDEDKKGGKKGGEILEKLLDHVRSMRTRLKDSPLRDAYGLTECNILDAMGYTAEALKLARKLRTPDAEVFIDDVEYRRELPHLPR
jgi:hypothetical protein